jgi:hypothetical protein
MPLKPLSEITGSLFPELPTSSPDSGAPQNVRATRRAALWREELTRAWGYWRGKASSEHEAARIDAAFEEQLAEGPDFTRYHRDSDFRKAPEVRLDRNDMAKLMTTYRAIERGSWKVKAEASMAARSAAPPCVSSKPSCSCCTGPARPCACPTKPSPRQPYSAAGRSPMQSSTSPGSGSSRFTAVSSASRQNWVSRWCKTVTPTTSTRRGASACSRCSFSAVCLAQDQSAKIALLKVMTFIQEGRQGKNHPHGACQMGSTAS